LLETRDKGHEVGIHCYDHIRWQDGLAKMTQEQVFAEFAKALREFQGVFNEPAKTAGAAGWQANANSLAAYDDAELLYGSDSRGSIPFIPRANGKTFKTMQIPTTLPTLDELVGRPEFPINKLSDHYFSLLRTDRVNIFTTHSEIEGMQMLEWFTEFVTEAKNRGVVFKCMDEIANDLLKVPEKIPVCDMEPGTVEGRSGTLATQSI